ncbi:MAG: dephospho-CoA kinase [Myxococcota bacterium]|nr:dephospho-CoA kinase [Myxococcota bacterium]
MLVWGLTGNIACGKSTVERMIREAGVPVIDADEVAREIVEPGSEALGEIVARFGEGLLDPEGRLDRPKLGSIVFSDEAARAALEGITHPRIHARIAEKLGRLAAEGTPLSLVSAALMVESGSYTLYAGILVVTCPEVTQLERLQSRDGLNRDDALARVRSQLPQSEKAALANRVIDNGGDVSQTRAQVEAWLADVRASI